MDKIKEVLTLIRDYCNSFSSSKCISGECIFDSKDTCGLENAPEWSDEDIEKFSKALQEFKK